MTDETTTTKEERWGFSFLAIPLVLAPLVNIVWLGNSGWPYWLWLLGGVAAMCALVSLRDSKMEDKTGE